MFADVPFGAVPFFIHPWHHCKHVLQGEIRCEQPNASLYTFTGNLLLSPPVSQEQTVPLSQASLLLRGSSLRNTKSVLGTVIFAGHQSKVSPSHLSCHMLSYQNSTLGALKQPALQGQIMLRSLHIAAV